MANNRTFGGPGKRNGGKSQSIGSRVVPVAHLLKIAACILLLFAATWYFGSFCAEFGRSYVTFLLGGPKLLPLMYGLVLSIVFMSVAAGLVVTLVRPIWIVLAAFAISAVFAISFLGVTSITAILGLFFFVCTAMYAISAVKKQKNQITWSLHPLFDAEQIFVLPLALLVAASFSFGYMDDARQRGFLVPPEIKQIYISSATSAAQAAIEKNYPKSGPAQQKAALSQAMPQIEKSWESIEGMMTPVARYVPIILGVVMFLLLESVCIVIAFVPLILLLGIFPLLRLARVTRYQIETVEAKRLVID